MRGGLHGCQIFLPSLFNLALCTALQVPWNRSQLHHQPPYLECEPVFPLVPTAHFQCRGGQFQKQATEAGQKGPRPAFEGSAGKSFKLTVSLPHLEAVAQSLKDSALPRVGFSFRRYRLGRSFFTSCCILHPFPLQLQRCRSGMRIECHRGGAMAIVTTANISASDQHRRWVTESPSVAQLIRNGNRNDSTSHNDPCSRLRRPTAGEARNSPQPASVRPVIGSRGEDSGAYPENCWFDESPPCGVVGVGAAWVTFRSHSERLCVHT